MAAPLALHLFRLHTHRWRGGLTSDRAYGAEKDHCSGILYESLINLSSHLLMIFQSAVSPMIRFMQGQT